MNFEIWRLLSNAATLTVLNIPPDSMQTHHLPIVGAESRLPFSWRRMFPGGCY